VLLLACAVLYSLSLPFRPVASPDEARYGAIAHEMLVSGDWVSPHFNGVRYFEKPVLGHWLNAAAFAVLGETPLALRLFSAIATALSGLIVFGLARRYLGSTTAWLATTIFSTTALVVAVGSFAVLDAYLAFFLTAALAAYYLALDETRRTRSIAYLVLCGAACAGAFLTKGFLGLAIPVIVATPYLLAQRNWRALLTTPWVPILTAGLLIAPWALMIHAREPDFWHYFFWIEHVQRFTAENAQHHQPFWYFLTSLPLTGWPWIFVAPAAAIGLRRSASRYGDGSRQFLFYLAVWALLPLLFFSLSKGKLATYILPCFAPFSIWLAAGLKAYETAGFGRAVRVGATLVLVLLLAGLGVVIAGQIAMPEPAYGPTELTKFLIVLACLAGGAACAAVMLVRRPGMARVLLLVGPALALLLPLQYALPQRILENVAPADAAAAYRSTPADTLLVSDSSLFGTVAWALKRDDIYLMSPGEIQYGLSYPESRHRWLDEASLAALIEANAGRHDILVLCEDSTEPRVVSVLPARATRRQQGKLIAWFVPRS
jgi:4-amino-4-deoxy-L-arabinose transferase